MTFIFIYDIIKHLLNHPSGKENMDNLGDHMNSVLQVMCLLLISFAYIKKTEWKHRERLDSAKWNAEHIIARMKLDTVTVSICSPAVEELIFRAPVIIMFSSLSSNAWYAVMISSVLFSLVHLPKLRSVSIYVILGMWNKGTLQSDSVKQESARLMSEQNGVKTKDKAVQLLVAFFLGVIFSCIGIIFQDLWLCVIIHIVWNLVGAELFAKIIIAMKRFAN